MRLPHLSVLLRAFMAAVRRSSPVILAAAMVTSCGGSETAGTVIAPSPSPTTNTAEPFTVSGSVLEYTDMGARPLAGLRVTIQVFQYPDPTRTIEIVSDAYGGYSVGPFPGRTSLYPYVSLESAFGLPCPDAVELLRADTTLNIDVVSTATLATRGMPASLRTRFPSITGQVVDESDGRGVAGAAIELLFPGQPRYPNDVKATTVSNSTGQYLVCVPPPGGNDQTFGIAASHQDYLPVIQTLQVSFDGILDVRLRPR